VSKKKVPPKSPQGGIEERMRRLEDDVYLKLEALKRLSVALQERLLQLEEKKQSSWWRW
jgi:hypothetical protein